MEKRVVIFLILSLAIIIGYDYLLKQMGFLSPTQSDAPAPSSSEAPPSVSSDVSSSPPLALREANSTTAVSSETCTRN